MHFSSVSVILPLVSVALAAPHSNELQWLEKKDGVGNTGDGHHNCIESKEYQNVHSEEVKDVPWVRVDAVSCTSSKDLDCEINNGYAHTVSVEYSIGGSIGGGLDLPKVASLSADAGFTYTWGTSDETSQGTTVKCPPGGITCSAAAHARKVRTTGQVKSHYSGASICTDGEWKDFEVIAPLMTGDGDNRKADVQFDICMTHCWNDDGNAYPNSCPIDQYQIHYCPNYPALSGYPM